MAQYGDHIWVAKGTYVPAQDGNREVSFVLNNGVKWYGGFAGGEMSLNERDWELNETVLSGEIGNPDSLADNSLHVVYGEDADSTTLIDGFSIVKGFAKSDASTSQEYKNGLGGGIFVDSSNSEFETQVVVSNCDISSNFADKYGGGGFIENGQGNPLGNPISPKFFNVVFINNFSSYRAGGFSLQGGGELARPEFVGCKFLNNLALDNGGGLYYYRGNGTNDLLLKDCHFEGNFAGNKGGACLLAQYYLFLPADIVNCSFIDNHSEAFEGAAIHASAFATDSYLRLENCRFENNSGDNNVLNCWDKPHSRLEMNRCVFKNNSTIMSFRGRLLASNCMFYNNTGNWSFHLSTDQGEGLDFINCFFGKNDADLEMFRLNYGGSGSYVPDGPLRFRNCIFQNNRNLPSIYPLFVSKTDADIELDHCLINEPSFANCQEMLNLAPVFGGLGEIFCNEGMLYNTDALFVSAADEDYRLQPCSPLRNAGTNIPWDTLPPQPDLEGNARIQEGVVDIGPYEVGAVALWADSIQPVSCPGYDDGAVWLQDDNTCNPAQYTINGAPLPSLPASNLAPGEYIFTVTDTLNRTDTFSVTLEAPVPVTASASVFDASGLTAADGQIWLDSIEGGAPPYTLLWSNGATSDTLTGLLPGIYTLTVTDSLDCAAVFEWELGFVKSVEEVSGKVVFQFWPNPAENTLWIRFHLDQATPVRLQLSDLSGNIVWQREEACSLGTHVWKAPLDKLPPGIYFGHLNQTAFRFVKN
ncbi:MAG: hypothetical protein IPH04_07575 [Saprospirales bacterium]|nr:hypothetical protein [Saprospirales bacterium]